MTFTLNSKLGRTFNHIEDLVFLYGSNGALEAVQHFYELNSLEGSKSIRFKWDGGSQVFWGREWPGGPLVIATHNSWQKQIKSYSSDEIFQFIVERDRVNLERTCFAEKFASLYPLLDQVTPSNSVGFFYADAMYLSRPAVINGNFEFSPNRQSRTTYYVKRSSNLGQKIEQSSAFLAGHAYYREFGSAEIDQDPIVTFDHFNYVPEIIIHNPIYNQSQLNISVVELDTVKEFIVNNQNDIDKFLTSVKGLADLREIIYKYVNYCAKQQQLHTLSKESFLSWVETANISLNKRTKIKMLDCLHPSAIDSIFTLVKMLQKIKNNVIDQLESMHSADIWDSNGEGRVRYADLTKKFGHVKLVPRHRWTPQ